MIASMYVGNVMLVIFCIVSIPFFIWALQKATPFLTSIIVAISFAGVYSLNNWTKDIWIMIACALVGFLFKQFEIPAMPALLGIILGSMMEAKFMNAITLSRGSFSIFVNSPISATLLVVSLLILVVPTIKEKLDKRDQSKKAIG